MAEQFRKVPLWSIWVVPFVVQIFAVVGLVGYLSFLNGRRAVNDLVDQLTDKVGQQVNEHLDSYLALPIQIAQMNLQTIDAGDLNIHDRQASERYFWRQSQAFPTIGYVGYSLPDGTEVGAGRWVQGLGVLLYENLPGENNSSDYLSDQQGRRIQRLQTYEYEPTTDQWYQDAVAAGKLRWTRTYAAEITDIETSKAGKTLRTKKNLDLDNTLEYYIAISAAAPFYDHQGKLQGVVGIDLLLTQISEFLCTLKISQSGRVFIVEHDGLLVASSTAYPTVYKKDNQVKRYTWLDSPDPLVREIAQQMQPTAQQLSHEHNHKNERGENHNEKKFEIVSQNQRYHVKAIHWYNPTYGLDWIVIATVPESDFMFQINKNTRQTTLLCLGALGVATLLGALTCRWVTRPIWAINWASRNIADGHLDQQIGISSVHELNIVGQSFNYMAMQLKETFTQLEYTATHDALTGLLNRAAFQNKLTETIERYDRSALIDSTQLGLEHSIAEPKMFAILLLDLDFFKLVNDSLGHLAGDQLLIEVTRRLKACVRTQDALSRFGGDEFVMLLESLTTPLQATQVAERIISELKKPFLLNDKTAFISTSIGIVLSSPHVTTATSMLRDADIALYRAKANGKAVYEVFDNEMHTEVVERLQLENELRQAIERSDDQTELSIYYQPVVETHTLNLIGLEALLRWHHPTLGTIPPAKFVPIAEETGLIVPLGLWVLQQACRQMYRWQQQFPQSQSMVVSVNLSTRQFLQLDLPEQIERILQDTKLAPHCLKLEITESLLISDRLSMKIRLNQLKALGVQFSLDDFGTGYSSLSYLHQFPLDTLKIDRSFIRQMTTDARSLAVVESITALAHKLGMDVVAEGVETEEQLHCLRRIVGCEQIQGFLIAPALTAECITQWLKAQTITPDCLNSHPLFNRL